MSITRELYEFIVKIVEDKIKDVRVSREQFDRLVEVVNRLADAQARTEKRLNALAKAQQRTEKQVYALAEAQRLSLIHI